MNTHFTRTLLITSVLFGLAPVSHAENFTATVTLDGITRSLTFATFGDAINAANNPDQYKDLFPGVTSTVGAVGTLDFKGVPIEFNKVSKDNVIIQIPNLGINESITADPTGKTSAAISKELNTKVETLIKSNNASINKELAKVDPADPLGGNPSSLMGIMVENAYLLGISDDWGVTPSKKPASAHEFAGGARYGHYALQGKSVDTLTFPLGYTFNINERQQFIVSVPFTYVDTQGAASYDGGMGFAYKYRVNDQWVLTPAVAYGFRGSFDLADVGHVVSGTVTSKYTFDLDPSDPSSFKLSVGNMLGYYTTLPYAYDGYSLDPDLQSYIFKNGLVLSKTIRQTFLGNTLNVAANFTDTEYFGSPFFVDQYNELGVSVKATNDNSWITAFSFNANYLFSATGKDVQGYRLGLSYQF